MQTSLDSSTMSALFDTSTTLPPPAPTIKRKKTLKAHRMNLHEVSTRLTRILEIDGNFDHFTATAHAAEVPTAPSSPATSQTLINYDTFDSGVLEFTI